MKIIVKRILSDLSEEMRGKVKEAISESTELDELVKKAKKRGKFIK